MRRSFQTERDFNDESTQENARQEAREPTLSVVVLARNEVENIGRCIESIFEACRGELPFEVMLVDSNSSDGTVEVAMDYPITIYRIPEDELTSVNAGRHVGTEYARGELLLLVDGDMVLSSGWVKQAADLLLEMEDVAGVNGYLNEPPEIDEIHESEVDALCGTVMYETAVLREIGGFDPFLKSQGDMDVGYKLTGEGYRLLRLPTVVADHPYPDTFGSIIREPIRRWRNGYYQSMGEAIRKSISDPRRLRKHLYERRFPLLTGGWLILGALTTGRRRPLAGWLFASLGMFAYLVRTQGIHQASMYTFSFFFSLAGIVLGFLQSSPPPEEFPTGSIIVVKFNSTVHE